MVDRFCSSLVFFFFFSFFSSDYRGFLSLRLKHSTPTLLLHGFYNGVGRLNKFTPPSASSLALTVAHSQRCNSTLVSAPNVMIAWDCRPASLTTSCITPILPTVSIRCLPNKKQQMMENDDSSKSQGSGENGEKWL